MNSTDLAIAIAEALCRRFEGFCGHPYLCPAGVPTIGYGATHYLDGRTVTLKDAPISKETATVMLRDMLRTDYLPKLMAMCPKVDSPERMAALLDFVFNLGAGQLRSSTLRKRVNAEAWGLVPSELRKWTRGGGRVLKGLVIRREAEAALI